MSEVTRPDFTYQWSSGGSLVAPSNVKIQTGWTAEVPPFQWENWSQNRQDNAIVHIFQKGISVWSSTQDYYFAAAAPKAFTQGSDGLIYEAVQSSTNQNPTTDTTNTYWRLAFKNQSGSHIYALDTGTANTYKADYTPVVKTLVDGMVLKVKALNANTTASTFTPANGVIAAAAIVGLGHSALQGGEIVANGDIWLQWNSSIGGGSWVLVANSGGAMQVASATKSQHAVQLAQVQSLITNMQLFTASGSFTVPSNVTKVKYRAVGVGAGGGGSNAASSAAGGAGSGSYSEGILAVTPGASLTVTIGVPGTQGTTGNGNAGGTTTITGTNISVSVFSGGPSLGASGGVPVGAQGLGGPTSVTSGANVLAALNVQGAPGQAAFYGSASGFFSGNGGNSVFGGGLPGTGGFPGNGTGAYGAGGAGGANGNFGGNGSPSVVIFEW